MAAVTGPGAASRQAHRVIFIDLARSLAVVMMVVGHTSSALLDASYRSGPWFGAWTFQRGLTSGLFLLLAGFAFSLATTRHWAVHLRWSATVFKRVRRFLLFVLLGYALHFPGRFVSLPAATAQQWRSFLAIDVLQLIGVALLVLQAFVMITRTRRLFMVAVFAAAAAVVAVSPLMWRTDWAARAPLWVAGYLSPSTGALFPLFPWLSYVFVGAAIGQLYARWGAAHLSAFASWAMLVPGMALLALGFGPMTGLPSEVVIRLGSCLVVVGVLAHASRRIDQLPRVFGAVAQESLVVYFVHLCVVYGSVWNPGLVRLWGEALSLGSTALAAVVVAAAMVALAFHWNRLKHVRPRAARWVTATAGIVLTARLL